MPSPTRAALRTAAYGFTINIGVGLVSWMMGDSAASEVLFLDVVLNIAWATPILVLAVRLSPAAVAVAFICAALAWPAQGAEQETVRHPPVSASVRPSQSKLPTRPDGFAAVLLATAAVLLVVQLVTKRPAEDTVGAPRKSHDGEGGDGRGTSLRFAPTPGDDGLHPLRDALAGTLPRGDDGCGDEDEDGSNEEALVCRGLLFYVRRLHPRALGVAVVINACAPASEGAPPLPPAAIGWGVCETDPNIWAPPRVAAPDSDECFFVYDSRRSESRAGGGVWLPAEAAPRTVISAPLLHGVKSERVGSITLVFAHGCAAAHSGTYEFDLLAAARCSGEHVVARRLARVATASALALRASMAVVDDIYPAGVAARLTRRLSVGRVSSCRVSASSNRLSDGGGAAENGVLTEVDETGAAVSAAGPRSSQTNSRLCGGGRGSSPGRVSRRYSMDSLKAGALAEAAASLGRQAQQRRSADAAAPPALGAALAPPGRRASASVQLSTAPAGNGAVTRLSAALGELDPVWCSAPFGFSATSLRRATDGSTSADAAVNAAAVVVCGEGGVCMRRRLRSLDLQRSTSARRCELIARKEERHAAAVADPRSSVGRRGECTGETECAPRFSSARPSARLSESGLAILPPLVCAGAGRRGSWDLPRQHSLYAAPPKPPPQRRSLDLHSSAGREGAQPESAAVFQPFAGCGFLGGPRCSAAASAALSYSSAASLAGCLSSEAARREEAVTRNVHHRSVSQEGSHNSAAADKFPLPRNSLSVVPDAHAAATLPLSHAEDDLYVEHHENVSVIFADVVGVRCLRLRAFPVG